MTLPTIAEQIAFLETEQRLLVSMIAESDDSKRRRFYFKRLVRNIKSRYLFERLESMEITVDANI
jgi:hypothetical protein